MEISTVRTAIACYIVYRRAIEDGSLKTEEVQQALGTIIPKNSPSLSPKMIELELQYCRKFGKEQYKELDHNNWPIYRNVFECV